MEASDVDEVDSADANMTADRVLKWSLLFVAYRNGDNRVALLLVDAKAEVDRPSGRNTAW